MSSKISIDVVLIPEEKIVDLSIKKNKELIKKYGPKIELGQEEEVPHITLGFTCIDKEDLSFVIEKIEEISKNFSQLDLEIIENINGENSCSFSIGVTDEIYNLHKRVADILKPLRKDVTRDSFNQKKEISDRTLLWVNTYLDNTAYENFWPHITLGKGTLEELNEKIPFKAKRLEIYQLGDHCTCQKKLASYKLK